MPDWAPEVRRRLDALTIPAARKGEIVEELVRHLEDRYQEHLAKGRSPAEARRHALAELQDHGALGRELERLPGADGAPSVARRRPFAGLAGDARRALRMLGRHRGRTAVLVFTLGLGIAATTTMYAIFDAVVVRPLFEVGALDPGTYVAAAAVLAVTTALAVWPSARLATRIDIVRSLRPE
jgi:hypothetical protein